MSAPGSPSTVTATVTTKAHFTSTGAEPQPGLSEAFPGRGEVPEEVSSSLASSESLWTAQGPVLVVDRVFDGQGVLVREEGDVGLRLGQFVEHPPVRDTLPMGGDRTGGEIGDQTLAIGFVQTAAIATTAVV